ncbi:hypothetical protein IQ16_07757 [Bradyrhizobium huanghuaihaiense]|uniref:Nucleotide-diphospho-sugar transferase n=1 Tax=Bradyrhizobium huanghuaihaiense TaxID=990078 RepID=A0A562QU10_9BRAD|nr:hypothetical protein [Bradyrhizobium huanghuaihaiense]TWI60259.1 hypothetical protein IQ16_07757 [Bradyrhizobium huanghuaihaiense]
MPQSGILYVATGSKHLAEAEHSAKSVKRVSPEIPIAIVSDSPSTCGSFDVGLSFENPERSLFDKVSALSRSPFSRTLFLDTDTFAMEPLEELFELLDRFDIAAAAEPVRYLYSMTGVPTAFPELNSGVILYKRNDAVDKLLTQWDNFYKNERASIGIHSWPNQPSFTRAVYNSEASFLLLPPEFNARIMVPQAFSGRIRIVHSRLKRPEFYAKALAELNENIAPRTSNPSPTTTLQILRKSLRLSKVIERESN